MRAYACRIVMVVMVAVFGITIKGMAEEEQKNPETVHTPTIPITPPVHTLASIAANRAISQAKRKEWVAPRINLQMFDDSDKEACAKDKLCKRILKMRCYVAACDQPGVKSMSACVDPGSEILKIHAETICAYNTKNSLETAKAILQADPSATQDDIVRSIALMQAIKGDSQACQDTIKKFVGPYGSSWNKDWYVAMSGCRILSKERSIDEENNDFSAWVGAVMKQNICADIVNTEMFNACSAPGAVPPITIPGGS